MIYHYDNNTRAWVKWSAAAMLSAIVSACPGAVKQDYSIATPNHPDRTDDAIRDTTPIDCMPIVDGGKTACVEDFEEGQD